MTRIVVSLTENSTDALARAARQTRADLVELRLDALPALDAKAIETLAQDLPVPAIATLRPTWEGGQYAGSEAARERLLRAAIDAGFPYVDVEAAATFASDLVAHAATRGARVILSRHDFEKTPPPAEVAAHFAHAHALGAWAGKFATRVRDARDAESLVAAALSARASGHRFALMGVNDAFLRLLAPSLGAALAYARPDTGEAAAPGQLPLAALRSAHAALLLAPRATTRLVLLLGDPVAHSLSPRFQNAAFQAAGIDATYVATRVEAAQLAQALASLKALNGLGANVTVPHKEAAARLVDELHPTAREIKAVNTIAVVEGRLVGYNTDGAGALRALQEAGVGTYGKRALVLGAGGTARAVAFALEDAGAKVEIANRTAERAQQLARAVKATPVAWADLPEAVKRADLVANCTTVGMHADESPLPASLLRPGLAVLDAVYRPDATTRLAREAAAAGALVVRGEAMLLHQGAAAFEVWTGTPAPLAAMRDALGGRSP